MITMLVPQERNKMNIKQAPDLFAWIGEDELGSGIIGLKRAQVPAGNIPLVAIESHRDRIDSELIRLAMGVQAQIYDKTISLVRYIAVEIVRETK